MLFANGSQRVFPKMSGQANKSRPQTTVDIGNFAIDQAAHEDMLIAPYQTGSPKNLLTVRMRPPASADWSAGYGFGQAGKGPLATLQNDAVLPNEAESIDAHANTTKTKRCRKCDWERGPVRVKMFPLVGSAI